MKKRIISFIMALVLLICVVPNVNISVDAAVVRYWPVPGHKSYAPYSSAHKAIDINGAGVNGATVIASIGGTVVSTYRCGTQHYGSMHTCSGFGTGVIIRGDDGWYYQYAHMQANSMPSYVQNGAYIPAGNKLGCVGTTGNSSGPHLHFEISTSMWAGDINPGTLTFSDALSGANYLNIGDDFEAYIKFSSTGHGVCNVNRNVQLGTYGTVDSRWRFIRQSDNSYKIVSVLDGRVMDVKDFSSENETNLQVFTSNDSLAQRFYIQKAGNKYNIISAFCGKAIDVKDGANSTIGTNIHIYSQTGTADQIFEINKLSDIAAANCANLGNDFEAYIKFSATGHGVCNVNRNVELGKYGSAESKWRFIRQSNGSYKIVSTVDDKVMDVKDFSGSDGANLQVFTNNNSLAQRFYIVPVGDKYKIISSFCGKAMAAKDGKNSTDATNVYIYSQNNTVNQIFEIISTTTTKNGWIKENGKWRYYNKGVLVKNQWKKDSVGWCYLDSNGYMATNCWVKDSTGWCYVGADGYAVTNCWKQDSTGWIWLNANGSMTKNQWILDSGKWYFLDENGYMVSNQWRKDSIGWVYLGSDGAMLTNAWCTDSQGWCYVGADGYAVTNCWKQDSYGWIWLNANGSMTKNNWVLDGGSWYYLDGNGYMIANTSRYIGGKLYYFNGSGVCINP